MGQPRYRIPAYGYLGAARMLTVEYTLAVADPCASCPQRHLGSQEVTRRWQRRVSRGTDDYAWRKKSGKVEL